MEMLCENKILYLIRAEPPQGGVNPFSNIHELRGPIRRIVGAGEDVDVGMGPLWLPVPTTASLLLILLELRHEFHHSWCSPGAWGI